MITEAQFQMLHALAWHCDGEAVCIGGLNADHRALVANGLVAVSKPEDYTVLTITGAGIRQLAS